MTATYDCIATTTLTTSTNTVDFTSISGTYTDLIAVCSMQGNPTNDLVFRFNDDSGSTYSQTILYGDGSSAGSTRFSNSNQGYVDYYAAPQTTNYNISITQIMNYSNTTTYKTVICRSSTASNGVDAIVNLWRSTSAITKITFYLSGQPTNKMSSGSTLTLYGVKAE